MQSPPERTLFTDVRRVEETGSTNDDLMARARQGDAEGIVLVAGYQSGGRGRHGRVWTAPPESGLLCSVLLRPPARVAGLVTATVAVALVDACESLGAVGIGIKWPNDLIVGLAPDERKLAGILAEVDTPVGASSAAGPRVPGGSERLVVVVGAGVNVHTPAMLPDEVADRYVGLDDLVAPAPRIDDVLTAYLGALEVAYAQLLEDRSALLDRWRSRCTTLGRAVRVDLGTWDLEGVAVRIDDQGRLVVRSPDGEEVPVAAGDVVHLEPPRT